MAAFHADNDRRGALPAFDARPAHAYSPPMAILDLLDLPAALPAYAPIVGLDPGEKTIGVAVSDVTRTVASPWTSSAGRSSPRTPRPCSS